MAKKKKQPTQRDKRRLRTQQIIFTVIAIMIILVMVVGMFARY
jgi:predicted nucleic acid-binding Zn ribbon protein